MSATAGVLADPDLDRQLAERGIVEVPLLGPADLEAAQAAYWELAPPGEHGIHLDFLRDDRELVHRLADVMAPVWERVLPGVLPHHYLVYSSFVVKHPGPDSALFLHRDMAVDDERMRTAYAFWMPFVDVSPELDNGPLSFIPGSHHIAHGQCGPTTVMQFLPYVDHLRPLLEPIALSAGTALVYDARMLHASEPNNSSVPRLAIGGLLAHRNHPVIQVCATGRRHRVVHEVDRDYFCEYQPLDIEHDGMPECYEVIDEYDEDPVVTTAEFLGADIPSDGATRAVVVPEDLSEVIGDATPLDVERGHWMPTHDRDVALNAADVDALDSLVLGSVEIGSSGAVGTLALVRDGQTLDPLPSALPDIGDLIGGPIGDADLLVLDAYARVVLTDSRRESGENSDVDVVIIECAPVRCGAASGGSAAELDLGTRIPLAGNTTLHLWNGGPGATVAILRRRRPSRTRPLPWWSRMRVRMSMGSMSDD